MNYPLQSTLFQVLLLLTVLTSLVKGQGQCHLCTNPGELVQPDKWGYRFGTGETCQDLYVRADSIPKGENACDQLVTLGRNTCCNAGSTGGTTGDTTGTAPAIPAYNGEFGYGDEPDCPICGTAEYPSIPGGFIVARYVGSFTCGQLYHRGLNGLTPDFMCGPLQDFAGPVCGCGVYNPACRTDPSKCYGQAGYQGPISNPVTQTAVPVNQTPAPAGTSLTAAPNASPTGTRQLRGGNVESNTPPPPSAVDSESSSFSSTTLTRPLTAADLHFSTRPADAISTEE